jgi:hypothetical protein
MIKIEGHGQSLAVTFSGYGAVIVISRFADSAPLVTITVAVPAVRPVTVPATTCTDNQYFSIIDFPLNSGTVLFAAHNVLQHTIANVVVPLHFQTEGH